MPQDAAVMIATGSPLNSIVHLSAEPLIVRGSARQLAQTMVDLGNAYGVRTSALLTRMDTPLGRAVGNAVEVEESVATLCGQGPAVVSRQRSVADQHDRVDPARAQH